MTRRDLIAVLTRYQPAALDDHFGAGNSVSISARTLSSAALVLEYYERRFRGGIRSELTISDAAVRRSPRWRAANSSIVKAVLTQRILTAP